MSESSFLDFDFVPVELEHYETLTKFLGKYPQSLSGYTMAPLVAWSPTYRYEWAFADTEILLISCIPYPETHRQLMQPIGPLNGEVQKKIIASAGSLAYPLKMVNVTKSFIKKHPELLRSFSCQENRSFSNYLYRADALAKLRGRKYSKKRNLLSQASKLYAWECRPLTEAGTGDCKEVLDTIQEEEQPAIEGMLEREITALQYTLDHFKALHQKGLLIYIEGKPVAFSIFEEISPKVAAVHFERALRRYKGLYQVINWETSKIIAEKGYESINREEDLGDRGLRDAKKSYHPIKIIPSLELIHVR